LSFTFDASADQAAPVTRSGVAQQGLKVYLWPEAFRQMQAVQKAQRGSPRFDLGDLTSAAVFLLSAQPHFARRVIEQARVDFVRRYGAQP
jgi:hypothetical protein